MVSIGRFWVLCAIGLNAGGCSIHPLPEEATGLDTYEIVKQIRCETRDSIESYAIGYIQKFDFELADNLKSHKVKFKDVDRSHLPVAVREAFEKYDQSAIAYDFTFDITEVNKATANADFARIFTRGPFNFGLNAGKELQRQNTRNFRISDTFEGLLVKLPDEYCSPGAKDENLIYPISGKIGVDKLTSAFLDLNQSGNLSPKEGGKVPVIADTIEFTTKISGTANPRVELKPLSDDFQLVKAGLTLDASRSDKHKVILAMSLPPESTPKKVVAKAGGTAKTGAERRALQELDRQQDRAFRVQFEKLDKRLDELGQ